MSPLSKLTYNLFVCFREECALIAQSVEQRIENPRVPGSIPGQGTILLQVINESLNSEMLRLFTISLNANLLIDF